MYLLEMMTTAITTAETVAVVVVVAAVVAAGAGAGAAAAAGVELDAVAAAATPILMIRTTWAAAMVQTPMARHQRRNRRSMGSE